MPVADVPSTTTAEPATRPAVPAPGTASARPVVAALPDGRRPATRPDGLGEGARRLLAAAFVVAWILCPALEPMPAHDVDYPLWQAPIELASFGSIVAAAVALWRGSRHSAPLGLVAGVLMAVMVVICPLAGHTPVGWWTWVQTALSLSVMGTSAVLHRFRPAADRRG